MKKLLLLASLICVSHIALAEPTTLDQLLEQVKEERSSEKKALVEREMKFKQARDKQKQLLANAETKFNQLEEQSESLKVLFESNERLLTSQQSQLKEKMGNLGELDGIVKQIAGDMDSIIDNSLISAQKPNRDDILDILSSRKELPSLKELEDLWLLAMDEMVESGKVVTFKGTIVTAAGNEIEQDVTRVGVFNAVSAGRFLRNLPETNKLIEPGRQPGAYYQEAALDLQNANAGIHPFPVDPTRGAMLALLVQVPDLKNRIEQGGYVGFIIIFIGVIGLLISLERFIRLTIVGRKVSQQLKSKNVGDNPLGRIMKVYMKNRDVDTETLSLKMDEAILKEIPRVKRGLATLALLAAVSPLLGLLGTVTGIIETFQSITLYGTGDPRVMSGGISQALVTTVMGLVVAIPLLLLHSFLLSRSNALVQILDEKSAAFIAMLAEKKQK